jgi:hypothetical protein
LAKNETLFRPPSRGGFGDEGEEANAEWSAWDARLVFGAAGFERNGSDVLRSKNASWRSFRVVLQSSRERFAQKRSAGGKKLHRPIGNHDVISTALCAVFSATNA